MDGQANKVHEQRLDLRSTENALIFWFQSGGQEDEDSEDEFVDLSEIKSYEDPGALFRKSQPLEAATNDTSFTNVYDNLPNSPPKSNDDDSYLHVDEENISDSDGRSSRTKKKVSAGVLCRKTNSERHERFALYFLEYMKQELEDEARRIMVEADSLISHSQPRITKEEVVICTEQITKRIQELLLAAQAGKHSR